VRFSVAFPEAFQESGRRLQARAVVAGFLAACALAPFWIRRLPAIYLLGAFGAVGLALVAVQNMAWGLTVLVFAGATVPLSIGTGTQSAINLAMMLVALLSAVWLARMVLSRRLWLVPTGLNAPLLGFLAACALAWIGGGVLAGQRVALPGNILVVQAGQFAVYALSAAAFFLVANHRLGERLLKAWVGMIVLTGTGILIYQCGLGWKRDIASWTGGLYMWPFVLLLAQILFNPDLRRGLKLLGLGVLGLWAYWAATITTGWKSGWVPALLAFLLLLLLKSRRYFVVALLLLAVVVAAIGPETIGAALLRSEENSATPVRWTLWLDVFRMGSRSVLLGLGLANYIYYWQEPSFESWSYRYVNWYAFAQRVYAPPAHNMFADVFAQTGTLGLFFLVWALVAALRLGLQVRRQPLSGFGRALANGVLCGFAALIVASFVFAEWLLPFVYNLGLKAFPHSVYAWLLLGTLVSLQPRHEIAQDGTA
jgi:hypothetical protein